MKEDYARAIELPFWQAPNDYVFVSSKRDWMRISCNIWREPAKYSNCNGNIELEGVWTSRYERHKRLSYYEPAEENSYKACYWIVENSSWLKKIISERKKHFPGWEKYDKGEYKHYIFQSHDFYIEVIAKKYIYTRKLENKFNVRP